MIVHFVFKCVIGQNFYITLANSVNSDKLASDQVPKFFKQVLITVIMQVSSRQNNRDE